MSFEPGMLPDDDRLPPGTPESLFRIAQEALANIARHARASNVWVRLGEADDEVVLEVRDDGQGFDAASPAAGMGLANMRQRAAELAAHVEMESAPGAGTTLRVRVPLLDPLEAPAGADAVDVREWLRQADRALTVGTTGLQFTILFILLGLPFLVVFLGISAVTFGSMRAMWLQHNIGRRLGKQHQHSLSVGHRVYELSAWGYVLFLVVTWYGVAVIQGGLPPALDALPVILATLFWGASVSVRFIAWYRTRERYLGILRDAPLRQQVTRSEIQCAVYGLFWLIVIVVAWIVGTFHPVFPPHNYAQWVDDASLVILIVWPLDLAVEYIQTWRWKRRLRAREARSG